jgi:hypothetical protein
VDPVRNESAGTAENPVVLPAKEARQGNKGLPVVNVLIGGLVLVITAYIIVYFLVPPT